MSGYHSSNSLPVDQKTGTEWTYKLYFDPRADEKDNKDNIYLIKAEELKETFAELVDVKEIIKKVESIKHPMSEWEVAQELKRHWYIVFLTEYGWWSIEKDTEGITIMRSKEKKWVRDYYRGQSRKTSRIEYVDWDEGDKTVDELIKWLYDKDELNKVYNLHTSNCKHFAKRVFKLLAKEKKCCIQ